MASSLFHRSMRPLWKSWAVLFPCQRPIDSWRVTDGERWLLTPRHSKSNKEDQDDYKKTLGKAVFLPQRQQGKAPFSTDVSGRGPVRKDHRSPIVLGTSSPLRPVINLDLIRKSVYESAVVSPQDGALEFMNAETIDTENMKRFLLQVRAAHPENFIVMGLDWVSSHKNKELKVPDRMSLILLHPDSPELNPAERLWNILLRDHFADQVFSRKKPSRRLRKACLCCPLTGMPCQV